MTISYPLAFPSAIRVNSIAPTLQFINSSTRSPFTSERQAFRWDGEMWTLAYTTPPCEQEEADEWIAFAMKLRGSYGTFLIGDKSRGTSRGVGGGSPKVDGSTQTGYELQIKDAPHSITGWLVKGDYFQLGTGANARLYKLVEDADTNSSGNVTLSFVPKLRISPNDNDAVVIQDAVGVFCMAQNSVSWSVDANGHYRYVFSAEEAI